MKKFSSLTCCLILSLILFSASSSMAAKKLTLMLDWFPNIDHLPIYVAQQQGYFTEKGLEIEIITPSDTADALKLSATGNVDIAVSYQPQTIIAVASGLELKAVGRLVAHPLTTLLYLEKSGITKPTDLEGKKIGYTVPGLMDVLLEAFTQLNGIKAYTPINVGYSILPALSSGSVDAIMGPFKTYETVGMAAHGIKAGYFELEKYGIPDYEELIFVSGTTIMDKKAQDIRDFSSAIQKAMTFTKANPEKALELYFTALPDADRDIETAAYKLTKPYYAYEGSSDPQKWQKFADFALQHNLIEKAVDVTTVIDQP